MWNVVLSTKGDRTSDNIISVSYTHLDVYKRQVIRPPRRKHGRILSAIRRPQKTGRETAAVRQFWKQHSRMTAMSRAFPGQNDRIRTMVCPLWQKTNRETAARLPLRQRELSQISRLFVQARQFIR